MKQTKHRQTLTVKITTRPELMITCQVSSIPFKVPQRNEDREEDYYVFRIFYENLFRGGVIEFVLASHNFGVTKGWKKVG